MEGSLTITIVFSVIILVLLIIAVVSYLKYRNHVLIIRYFLHDLCNYVMSVSIFHDEYANSPKESTREFALKHNKIILERLSGFIRLFSNYFHEETLYKKNVDTIDLAELLKSRFEKIKNFGSQGNYDWNFLIPEKSIILRTNPYLVTSMVNNVFFNIIKHSKKGGEIDVELKEIDGKAVFTVINEKQSEKSEKKRRKGGLRFVKKFSPLINAKIDIDETDTHFTFRCIFKKILISQKSMLE